MSVEDKDNIQDILLDQLDSLKSAMNDIKDQKKIRETDKTDDFEKIFDKINAVKDNDKFFYKNNVPSYIQSLIAILVLMMSFGSGWMAVNVKTATISAVVNNMQKDLNKIELWQNRHDTMWYDFDGEYNLVKRDIYNNNIKINNFQEELKKFQEELKNIRREIKVNRDDIKYRGDIK